MKDLPVSNISVKRKAEEYSESSDENFSDYEENSNEAFQGFAHVRRLQENDISRSNVSQNRELKLIGKCFDFDLRDKFYLRNKY